MLVPIVAISFIILCALFAFKSVEHSLRGWFGEGLYDGSSFLTDLAVYASFFALYSSTYFVGCMLFYPNTTVRFVLCEALLGGYYLTFRCTLMFVFTLRFNSILKKRYGVAEAVFFDGTIPRYHTGGLSSYVASHLQNQMDISNRISLPIGIVWGIFIYVIIYYIPTYWLEGLCIASIASFSLAVACIFPLLPQTDDDIPIPKWRYYSWINLIPAAVFLLSFILLTIFFNRSVHHISII